MPIDLSDAQIEFLRRYLGIEVPASNTAAATGTPTGDLVRKRAFLISQWQRIPLDLQLEVSTMAEAVARDLPHEDADGFAARLGQYLTRVTADMQARVNDAVDTAVNAGDGSYSAVTSTIGKLRAEIASDDLMRSLAASPLAPGAGFAAAYTDALDEIEQALAA